MEGKPKHLIHTLHKVQTRYNLFFQLEGKNEKSWETRATRGHYNVNKETKTGEFKFQPGWEKKKEICQCVYCETCTPPEIELVFQKQSDDYPVTLISVSQQDANRRSAGISTVGRFQGTM